MFELNNWWLRRPILCVFWKNWWNVLIILRLHLPHLVVLWLLQNWLNRFFVEIAMCSKMLFCFRIFEYFQQKMEIFCHWFWCWIWLRFFQYNCFEKTIIDVFFCFLWREYLKTSLFRQKFSFRMLEIAEFGKYQHKIHCVCRIWRKYRAQKNNHMNVDENAIDFWKNFKPNLLNFFDKFLCHNAGDCFKSYKFRSKRNNMFNRFDYFEKNLQ